MRGVCTTMLRTIIVLYAVCSLVQSSGVAHVALDHAPVVTAASSQYFERTFNRLVVAPPVIPVAPPPPVIRVAPAPPVIVEPVIRTVSVPQNVPVEPNVAIAVATAHAAAPVATILLPPYPFGLPPTIGFIAPSPPIKVPDEDSRKEATTQSTTTVQVTSAREPEATTPLPLPSNTDNRFAQPLPSNQNFNFRQYYGPPSPPVPVRPQKLRTTVEIVPVPLQYIAPPPLRAYVKPKKYVHTFIPAKAKIIIRPVSRVRTVRVPARLVMYRTPISARNVVLRNPQNGLRLRPINSREIEPTTFRPFNRPFTKPPKL